eukprot:CAMPEP_0115164070 /NCGR_PEP_ID=MMETSP0227-20121206/72838_1 /TAXON_ID=89957 /ORGANISM="Polarella glacialis, Strain CCMP 1383" /LENGTH=171 /DNA_ID=CAMNT_0002576401 /DNA_START=64 /DNA_END=579 /DNA_ORIENTATION=+
MAEITALKDPRATLPGIPLAYTRVHGELVWAQRCDEELQQDRDMRDHPKRGHKRLGKIGGFEIVKYPSYVNIRRINSPRESSCSAIASMVTGIGPTRLSQLEGSPQLPDYGSSLSPSSPALVTLGASLSTVSCRPPLDLPKYMNHRDGWQSRCRQDDESHGLGPEEGDLCR